jgi:hypothetical protein
MGESNTTRLERGRGSDLSLDVLGTLLGKLSPDSSSVDFVTLPMACTPMCVVHVTQMKLL